MELMTRAPHARSPAPGCEAGHTGTGWTRPVSPGARCLPCIRRPPPCGMRATPRGRACATDDRTAGLAPRPVHRRDGG